MTGRYPLTKLNNYPRMLKHEVKIWETFLEKYGHEWESVDYDVRVGLPEQIDNRAPASYKAMIEDLSRSRIDAILYRKNEICIVEIKERAGLGILGQLIAYVQRFDEAYIGDETITACVVCQSIRPDAAELILDRNIDIYVIEREEK